MRINLLFLVLLAHSLGFAQSFSNSPTSYYGIGQFSEPSNAIYTSLGYNAVVSFDSSQLNTINPTSYSYLSKGNTLFFLGAGGRLSNYTSSTISGSNLRSFFMLDQYALGFNAMKGFGMAFGLRPFSQKGYYLTQNSFTGIDSLSFTYEGTGGISEVFYGIGYMPLDMKLLKFSLGVNVGYLFGKASNIRQSRINGSAFPYGESRENLRLNALKIDLSSSLDLSLGKNHRLLLSGIWSPQDLPADLRHVELFSTVSIGSDGRPAYQLLQSDTIDVLYSYNKIQAGLNYSLSLPKWKIQNKEIHPQVDVYFSYANQSTSLNYGFFGMKSVYFMSESYRAGIQFKPERNLFENLSILRFHEKLNYRVGYYTKSITLNNQQYSDYGITFGFGLPTLIQRSLSSVNLSFQLGMNTKENDGLKERYGAIQLGIVFAPSSFEKWFRKRKLD